MFALLLFVVEVAFFLCCSMQFVVFRSCFVVAYDYLLSFVVVGFVCVGGLAVVCCSVVWFFRCLVLLSLCWFLLVVVCRCLLFGAGCSELFRCCILSVVLGFVVRCSFGVL